MPSRVASLDEATFHAVTASRWADMERFFDGTHAGACWCMAWRLRSGGFRAMGSAQRKAAMKALVEARTPVGILGYLGGEPVGWCSVAPRETYAGMATARTIPPAQEGTWTVACLVVAPPVRGMGFSARLLGAAVDHARSRGARRVEGFPAQQRKGEDGTLLPTTSYRHMGFASTYRRAGFRAAKAGEGQRARMVLDL